MSWLLLGKFFYVVLQWCASYIGAIQFVGSKQWPSDRLVASEMKFTSAIWAILLVLGNLVAFLVAWLTGIEFVKIAYVRNNFIMITLVELALALVMWIANKLFPESRTVWGVSGVYCTLVPIAMLIASI